MNFVNSTMLIDGYPDKPPNQSYSI